MSLAGLNSGHTEDLGSLVTPQFRVVQGKSLGRHDFERSYIGRPRTGYGTVLDQAKVLPDSKPSMNSDSSGATSGQLMKTPSPS